MDLLCGMDEPKSPGSLTRPTVLDIVPVLPEVRSRQKSVRRLEFGLQTNTDDGRRNSFGAVSAVKFLPEINSCNPGKSVLDSPFSYGTRALRRWSSARIAAASPSKACCSPKKEISLIHALMKDVSLLNGSDKSTVLPSLPDLKKTRSASTHNCNAPPLKESGLRHMRNFSLPVITVTPHGVSTKTWLTAFHSTL